jgi:4-hydroxy-tetrahydrodipicolinate synthase
MLKLEGLVVPLITPLNSDETLDESGLERMIDYVITGGVSGIFVLGSSGEFFSLDDRTKERLVRAARSYIGDRVSLLVGISEAATRRTIQQGKRLVQLGADGLVVTAPYYYPHPPAELVPHFLTIARAFDAPTILYNIPQMVKVSLDPETVQRLAEEPSIIGIKDSAGDMSVFEQYLKIPNFSVTQGAETTAAQSVLMGAAGLVVGMANVAPRLCRAMFDAAKAGDGATAQAYQEQLMALFPINQQKSWVAGLKMAAHLLGLCSPHVTAPFATLSEAQISTIRQTLVQAGLLEA